MAQLTPNLNLSKPDYNDIVDIGVINGNMDKIDTAFKPTIDQSVAPTGSNSALISTILNWFANRIKTITGKANWYDAPSRTLEDLNNHINAAAPHSGHALVDHMHTKSQITDFAHTHTGADITSAVANATNADTVDGKHATDFAAASHTHTIAQITDIANIRTDSTKSLVVEVNSVAPSSPVAGQIWFDSANKKFKGFDGAAWL